jgi:hypothetical protein
MSFVSSDRLKNHISYKHTKEKFFKCYFNDCKTEFVVSRDKRRHMKTLTK